MTIVSFGSPDALVEHVNTAGILQADIVDISVVDSRWYLIHY